MECMPGTTMACSGRRPRASSRVMGGAGSAAGAVDLGTGLAEYGLMEPPPPVAARIPGASPLDPVIHFRHHGRANVVFVDGHVRALIRALSAESSAVYPGATPAAHGLGWF